MIALLRACCLLIPVLVACASAQTTPGSTAAGVSSERDRIERYFIDRASLERFYSFDAAPESLLRLDRLEQRARAELDALAAEDFDALDLDGRVDHVLLRVELEQELALHAEERERLARLAPFLDFAARIAALDEARRRVEPLDPRATAETLDALAKQVGELEERTALDATALVEGEAEDEPEEDPLLVSAVDALWLAGRVGGVRGELSEWFRNYDTYLPEFRWWCAEPYERLNDALDAYGKRLREDVAGQKGEDDDPMVGDPIGRDALLRDLAHEMIAYTPEELLAIGERELAWCETEIRRAAADMGLEDDWRAALERVKEMHVPPGEQDALVAGFAREAVAWLDAHELVTIPELCRETWRVRMIPKEDQRFFPFAFYGGQEVDVAYPTADMEHDAKLMAMRGNNAAFTRCVTPHELIPGHHLQGFMARRHAPHRRAFSTPFLAEGWALYWEMREWDLGWARTPEERIGMLFWRMHRAARIVVSLQFHLGAMTTDEMIALLVDRVGHERDNATAEVRRYVSGDYGPLYQCAYMIGGLQLMALHAEIVQSGRMSEREFHDAVLHAGPIPIEMLRALLTGNAPARDHAAAWRFDAERGR